MKDYIQIRTQADLSPFTFQYTLNSRGYPVIISKSQAKEILEKEADAIGWLEIAEIAVNGGALIYGGIPEDGQQPIGFLKATRR